MAPAVPAGSLVLVDTRCSTYTENDIALFRLPGTAIDTPKVLHRIVRVDEQGLYRTKGDANGSEDPVPVSPDRLRGRLVLRLPGRYMLLIILKRPFRPRTP